MIRKRKKRQHQKKVIIFFSRKRRKRDYFIKSSANPFFNKRKKYNLFKILNLILLIFIVGVTAWLFLFSNIFTINEVEVKGGRPINQAIVKEIIDNALKQKRWFIIPQNNIFFLNKKKLEVEIQKTLVLAELQIKKSGRNKIIITIKEKPEVAYLFNQGKIFSVDQDGILVNTIETLSTTTDKMIIYYNNKNLSIGEQLSGNVVQNLQQLYQDWRKNNLPSIDYVLIDDAVDRYIQVQTKDGFKVYLSRQYDQNKQLTNLKKLIRTKLKDQIDKLDYIDLRVEGWIYYK